MAYAQRIITSNSAGDQEFTFTFDYIKEEHIKVFVNFVEKTQGTGSNQFQVITNTTPKKIQLNTGLAADNTRVEIRRVSSLSTPLVDFEDGSTLTATDLDTAEKQSLFIAQELDDALKQGISIDTNTGVPTLDSQRLSNVSDPVNAQDAVTKNYLERNSSVSSGMIAPNAVTADKIGSGQVTETKVSNNAITQTKIANNAVIVDKIAPDAVNGTKIADDSINSEHYVDGSIDTAHIADAQITAAKLQDGSVTSTKLGADSVVEAKIVDANVTAAKLASNSVTSQKIQNQNVTTDKIADSAVTEAKIANGQVTPAKLANGAVTNDKIADTELVTLASMQSGTASKLADSTALTSDIADLNQLDGMAKETSITNSNAKFPTSKAVVDFVANQIAPVGGLEVIADEDSFPTTQPVSGVVISISNADGLIINSSGVATNARTLGNGSDNVTINNFPTSLRNKTLANELGLLVSSTGASQVYNYHKLLAKETDVLQLSDDINDFNNRYRVENTLPAANDSSNHDGDLVYAKDVGKIYVYSGDYNGTPVGSFGEVQSIGNFFIATLSPAFDGSTTDFTITNAPSSAEQILLVIEGVIQKPNSGSSTPGEGFALSGSTVKLAAAPAVGASYFAVIIGSTVNIGVPSDNTVTSAILQNAAVTTAKLATNAVTFGKLADLSVGEAKIVNAAVTTVKIAADAVNGSKIADDSIDSEHYVDGSIDTAHIADDAVTGDKIDAAAVSTSHIADNSITTAKIANSAVTDAKINGMAASKLTGALPAISGASLTDLPASGKPTNLVLNGAMSLAQRGTYSAGGEGYKTVDRFQYYKSGTNETPNQRQVDVASGTPAYQAGFRKAYQVENGNQSSAGGSDLVFIETNLEARDIRNSGWNYTDSNSKITLSFWVKSSVAQNFYGYLITDDGTGQRYAFETGSLTANTWTKVTKTIPGNSNLQFDDNSNKGLGIVWWPFLGTGYTDPGVSLNTWGAWATGTRTPDSTNSWYLTNDATFELTGVLLEVGDTASDFPFESPSETLRKCKRYCHVISKSGYSLLGIGMQYYSGTIFIDGGPIDMRATPTMVAKAGSSGGYVYEKVFGNSAEYIHQIGLDGKTTSEHAVFNMAGTASRYNQAVRCSAHAFSLSNNEPFVYLTAEI